MFVREVVQVILDLQANSSESASEQVIVCGLGVVNDVRNVVIRLRKIREHATSSVAVMGEISERERELVCGVRYLELIVVET